MAYSFCYACSNRNDLKVLSRLQQRYLGASDSGDLILVPMQKRPQKASMLGLIQGLSIDDRLYNYYIPKPPIAKLPDELLNDIFVLAVACDQWRSGYYTCALTLSRVCKLFHRIAQPLLFKDIQLSYPHRLVPACKKIRKLHRTIEADPVLGTFCKSVSFCILSFKDFIPNDYDFGDELLSRLPNVTSFNLYGGFKHPPTWPFLRKVLQRMPCIRDLRLSREGWDLHLAPVCDIIQKLQLQSLSLYGISPQEDRVIWAPNSKEIHRTSTITRLDISDFGERPEALQSLLKLPRSLEHFRFGKIHCNPVSWDLSFFQWLLHDHRASLKSIEIGALGRKMRGINLLDFPNLETLNLSRWVFDFSPEIACSTILAPKLHTFIWDFTVIDQHSESCGDFGQEQKDWILKFAELAIAQMSALKKIKIIFTPDEWSGPHTREELKDWVSPWDLMDEVRDAIGLSGIELSYNKCWSRQDCLDRIEDNEIMVMDRLEDGQNIGEAF